MALKRPAIAVILVLVLVAVSASACVTSTNNSTSSGGIVIAAEPTGGTWKPFVLNSSDALRSLAPPSQGSIQFNQDVNELKALQLNRTAKVNESIDYWNNGSVVRWNEIARSLVVKNGTSAPMASRVYALLSVAQYDALVSAWNNKYTYNRSSPHDIDPSIQPAVQTTSDPAYPSDHAAVAGASAAVLSYLYPNETAWLAKQAAADEESRVQAGVNFRSDITAGDSLGRTVAQDVINRAKSDGSNVQWNGTVPTGPGKWVSTTSPPQAPPLPNWGNVTPWLLNSSNMIMPPSPPVYGSAQFNASLQEVKQIANNRTAEQLHIAQYWNVQRPSRALEPDCVRFDSELPPQRIAFCSGACTYERSDDGRRNLLLESQIRLLVSAAHSGRSDNQNGVSNSELPVLHLRSLGFLCCGGRGFELHFPEGEERVTGKGPASIYVPTLRRNPLPV